MATSSVANLDCLANALHETGASQACPAAVAANTFTTEATFLEGPVPAGGGTVTNLVATVDVAPGGAATHTVAVMNNTTGAVLLSCVMTGTQTSCQNTGSAAVSAGQYLQVRVSNAGGAANNHSFRATFRY
jgi:hypothetical protein